MATTAALNIQSQLRWRLGTVITTEDMIIIITVTHNIIRLMNRLHNIIRNTTHNIIRLMNQVRRKIPIERWLRQMKLAPKKLRLANEGADVASPETPECSVPISTGDGATLELILTRQKTRKHANGIRFDSLWKPLSYAPFQQRGVVWSGMFIRCAFWLITKGEMSSLVSVSVLWTHVLCCTIRELAMILSCAWPACAISTEVLSFGGSRVICWNGKYCIKMR